MYRICLSYRFSLCRIKHVVPTGFNVTLLSCLHPVPDIPLSSSSCASADRRGSHFHSLGPMSPPCSSSDQLLSHSLCHGSRLQFRSILFSLDRLHRANIRATKYTWTHLTEQLALLLLKGSLSSGPDSVVDLTSAEIHHLIRILSIHQPQHCHKILTLILPMLMYTCDAMDTCSTLLPSNTAGFTGSTDVVCSDVMVSGLWAYFMAGHRNATKKMLQAYWAIWRYRQTQEGGVHEVFGVANERTQQWSNRTSSVDSVSIADQFDAASQARLLVVVASHLTSLRNLDCVQDGHVRCKTTFVDQKTTENDSVASAALSNTNVRSSTRERAGTPVKYLPTPFLLDLESLALSVLHHWGESARHPRSSIGLNRSLGCEEPECSTLLHDISGTSYIDKTPFNSVSPDDWSFLDRRGKGNIVWLGYFGLCSVYVSLSLLQKRGEASYAIELSNAVSVFKKVVEKARRFVDVSEVAQQTGLVGLCLIHEGMRQVSMLENTTQFAALLEEMHTLIEDIMWEGENIRQVVRCLDILSHCNALDSVWVQTSFRAAVNRTDDFSSMDRHNLQRVLKRAIAVADACVVEEKASAAAIKAHENLGKTAAQESLLSCGTPLPTLPGGSINGNTAATQTTTNTDKGNSVGSLGSEAERRLEFLLFLQKNEVLERGHRSRQSWDKMRDYR
eukprot:GHVQ01012766.1.p1 GENE.GHVQ01012766.1~~GHVQ01012766.1.p1  ORF type:complete len:674 (+),score=72.99 GHVQ01012766.1:354-2375(+)